jgi:TP901 family phage tail tape measure protein
MGERFNLTAQLQLQAPTNTRQVISQIRSQLQGVTVDVRVEANTRTLSQVNRSLSDINGSARNAATSFGFLNRNLSEAARRFGVITLATGTMLSFAQSVKRAVGDAIAFERQMVTLSQVTGNTVKQLEGVSQEVTRLSTSLGASSKELLNVAITLAQAGFSAEETRKSLDILAKTTLGPSFEDVTETVEGAIAVIRQFGDEAIAAGGNVKFLESTLDAINSVSKAFAVESSDLITVIRRTGGVFAAAGGSVNELIALFTSVRATTRESAETIATGLRTIFTRIQRTETVQQLESLGISLRDAEGRFVGAFEAVKRLSAGLSALDPRDIRFSSIVEELGGFRQIGKVIPLIQQFTVAQDALNVAQGASGSVAEDAITAQQALAVQAQKVREEFSALIRQLANSSTFREIATGALDLASALIKIGSALEPVLPLLTSLLALKVGQGLAPGLTALLGFSGGVRRRASGGVIRQFARGGFVPGTGNRDTVPAMLQPGEFVIRKSSVNKIGASNLAAMNENGYNLGGEVNIGAAVPEFFNNGQPIQGNITVSTVPSARKKGAEAVGISDTVIGAKTGFGPTTVSMYDQFALKSQNQVTENTPKGKIPQASLFNIANSILGPTKSYATVTAGITDKQQKEFKRITDSEIKNAITNGASKWASSFGVNVAPNSLSFAQDFQLPSGLVGSYFESIIDAFDGRPIGAEASESRRPFDFVNGLTGEANKKLFSALSNIKYIDAKLSQSSIDQSEYTKKAKNQLALESYQNIAGAVAGEYQKLLSSSKNKKEAKSKQQTTQKANLGGLIRRFAKGGLADAPMVDDILQATGSILPKPSSAIQALIKSGGGAVDIDRTLKRTVGDIAYAKAKTPEAQQSVLQTYFRDEAKRLQDLKSASLTQFGQELQNAIKSGQIDPRKISIISKSRRVKGAEDYLSNLFGIPRANMIFTQGGSKQPALDAMRSKGPRADRVQRFALGGGVGTDTVPALLTPGEFVINKKSAQSIGYGNLGRMNKVGKYANGGIVQRFANGGKSEDTIFSSFVPLGGSSNKFMAALDKATFGLLDFGGVALRQLVTGVTSLSNAMNINRSIVDMLGDAGEQLKVSIDQNDAANKRSDRQQELLAGAYAERIKKLQESGATDDQIKSKVDEYIDALEKDTAAKIKSATATNQSSATTATPTAPAATGSSQQDQTLSKLKQYITAKYQAQLNVLASQEALQRRGFKTDADINQEKQRIRQALAQQATAEYQVAKQSVLAANANRGGSGGGGGGGATNRGNGGRGGGGRSTVEKLDAGLAAQMSGLSDVQKQAITETAGFVTGIVGIVGTIGQLITSMFAQAAASTASSAADAIETTASGLSAAADTTESVASVGAGIADGAETVLSGTAAVADGIEATGSTVAAAADTAQAGASGVASAALIGFAAAIFIALAAVVAIAAVFKYQAALARAQAEELKKASDAQLNAIANLTGSTEEFARLQKEQVAKQNTASAKDAGSIGALIGGAIGSALFLILVPIIGPFAIVLGAALGAWLGAATAEAKERERLAEISRKYGGELELSSKLLAESTEAQAKFKQSLQDIDIEKNLTPETRIQRRITAQTGVSTLPSLAISESNRQLQRLAGEKGKSIGELQESDFEKDPELKQIFNNAQQTLAKNLEFLSQSVAESRKTLEEAAKVEITGDESLDDLLKNGGQLAQAFTLSQSAIRAESEARIAVLKAQKDSATTDKTRESLQKAINSEQQRLQQRLSDQKAGLESLIDEQKRFKEELALTTAANAEFRRKLLEINAVANSLTNVDNALNKLAKSASNLDSLLSGANFDFSLDAPEGLTSLENVGDSAAFGAAVDNIAAGLGAEGARLAENVKTAAEIIKKTAQSELVGVKFTAKDKQPTPEQFLEDIGLQPNFLGSALEKFREDFNKNLEDGILDADEAQSLIQPLVEQGKASAEQLNRFNEQQNKAISIYQNFVQQLKDQTDKEIEARQKLVSLVAKTEELRAKARGTELTSAQKESFRVQEAQVGLRGLKDVRGNQLQAGNVQQLSATRAAAFEERASIEADIKAGKVTADRAKREIELNNIIEKTTAELNRLTDQSDKAADILGEIDKERQKRETGKGLVEEFVVGGADQRKAINQAFAGVQAAIKTGTIQNQTPEQRKSTFDLLDRLKDFDFNIGGGRTLKGAQVKEEIIQRDAVRLGLDPKVLRALYGQTDKEKELINALDNLTNTIREAGGANVAFEEQKTRAAQQRVNAGARELGATGTARPGAPLPAVPPGQPAAGIAQAVAGQAAVAAGAAAVQAVNIPQKPATEQAPAAPQTREEMIAANKKRFEEDKARKKQAAQDRAKEIAEYQVQQSLQRQGLSDKTIGARAAGAAKRFKGTKEEKNKEEERVFNQLKQQQLQTQEELRRKKGIEVAAAPAQPPQVGIGQQQIAALGPQPAAALSPVAPAAVAATPTAPTSPTAAMGPIPIDTSGLSNVFNAFVGNFSSSLDNIVQKFSGIETAFGSLAQSLTGITMEHTVTVEGLISVGGLNLESIKQELSSSIGQMVAQEITNQMDAESRRFRI